MKDGKVVKGIKFENMRDIGYPPDLAAEYCRQGADEITFLDISATVESRKTTLDLVTETSKKVTGVPFAVGGGMRDVQDIADALAAGANKVSVNSAAVKNPDMISEASERFGKDALIIAIDVKAKGDSWEVYTHGGNKGTGIDAIEWAGKCEDLGAGAILVTSVDTDGVREGYDIPLTKAMAEAVNIPVTASGGCGSVEDIYNVLTQADCAAALAASIFHLKQYTVTEVKDYLRDRGVKVR